MLRRRQWLIICITLLLMLALSVCFCAAQSPVTQAQAPNEEGKKDPASSKITVEVKNGDNKEKPEVKVSVDGKETDKDAGDRKKGEPATILPSPGEKLSPLNAEEIGKATASIGKKVDEIELSLGLVWGSWVWTEAAFGITWLKLILVVLAIGMVVLIDRIVRWFITRKLLRQAAEQRDPTWQDLLLETAKRPLSLFILVYGIYAAISPLFTHLDVPGSTNLVRRISGELVDLAGTVAVLWLLYSLLRVFERRLKFRSYSSPNIDDLLVTMIGKSLRVVVILLGLLIVIQNLTGWQIGPLLASLGLGGLAVALAAKDTIANFFGTLTIIFDSPYHVGEHIRLDKYEGTVENIGFRSTSIRTFDGAVVSIPNEKAINSGVENIGRRMRIRWHTNLGLRYDTPRAKVAQAVEIVSEILNDPEHMNPEFPPRVFFNGFGDWSLNIAVFAWYEPAMWWDYQAWLQEKCFRIMSRFEEEGIEFAYPTSTVSLETNGDKSVFPSVVQFDEKKRTAKQRP